MLSFEFSAPFTCTMPDLVRERAILGPSFACLRNVFFDYTAFGFSLSWTAKCFPAEPRMEFFVYKHFMGGKKVHFLRRGFPFLPNFGIYLNKKSKKYREGMVLSKAKCHI